METRARSTWLGLCGAAGWLIASLPVIVLRSEVDEAAANVALILIAGLIGYTAAIVLVERRLPRWPRLRRPRLTRVSADDGVSKDRVGAYLLVYAAILAAVFGGGLMFDVKFASWPSPPREFADFVVVLASLALAQGVVEAWAVAHPDGKVARL